MNTENTELTYEKICSSYELWFEYVDQDGIDSEEDFNRMTMEQRMELIEALYWYEAQDQ
jgi:hypothetical protein